MIPGSLAAGRMLAAAAKLRQIFGVPTVFATILVVCRGRAATNRMRALLVFLFVFHHITILLEGHYLLIN